MRNKREQQHIDAPGAAAQQYPGAALHRRSRGQHVINQHHALAGDSRAPVVIEPEGPGDIAPALLGAQANLLARRLDARRSLARRTP